MSCRVSPIIHRISFSVAVTCLILPSALAQRGPGFGRGFRGGRGPANHEGQGFRGGRVDVNSEGNASEHSDDDRHGEDRDVFHFLLSNHDKITRTVKPIEGGVETVTESRDREVADMIKEHVEWMKWRVEQRQPIRMRDPLFAEIFRNAEKIEMQVEETEHGVRVRETSSDDRVANLIRQHADVVTGFVVRGFDEAMQNHPVPKDRGSPASGDTPFKKQFPVIKDYGGVVPLREAAYQPRQGSPVVVDVTGGGKPDVVLPSIEKLARYVNLYGGAGKLAVEPKMVVVLHGDATLAALSVDAYKTRFGTDGNPNLECMRRLHASGVKFAVCGQSLIGKGAKPADVVPFVDVAVSAMTALVNLQNDGYAYIPLR